MTRRNAAGAGLTGVIIAGLCLVAAAWVFHAGPRPSSSLFLTADAAAPQR